MLLCNLPLRKICHDSLRSSSILDSNPRCPGLLGDDLPGDLQENVHRSPGQYLELYFGGHKVQN